jgi:AmiR/NasT family two-component response regulator
MRERHKDKQSIGKYLETPLAPARLVENLNIAVVRFSDL